MSEWQDISTAPKDGTRVLLWTAEWETPQAGAMYGMKWACCSDVADRGGWLHPPTDWQPLPSPPEAK
jgi:hypothetical protein